MYPRACYFLLLLILSSKATANQITNVKQRNIERTVSVVNLEFCMSCLSAEEREYKKTYKEVSTYAELKQDPIADLPLAFTICSSAMTTYGKTQMFFTTCNPELTIRNIYCQLELLLPILRLSFLLYR